MSILKRFKDVVSLDYQEFLECENPLLINEVIRQLNEDFISINMEMDLAVTALEIAKSEVEQGEEMMSHLFKEAITHLHMGQNEEARVFLNKKAMMLEKQTILKEEYNQAELHVAKVKEVQQTLETEITSLIARRENLPGTVERQSFSSGRNSVVNTFL